MRGANTMRLFFNIAEKSEYLIFSFVNTTNNQIERVLEKNIHLYLKKYNKDITNLSYIVDKSIAGKKLLRIGKGRWIFKCNMYDFEKLKSINKPAFIYIQYKDGTYGLCINGKLEKTSLCDILHRECNLEYKLLNLNIDKLGRIRIIGLIRQ